MIKLIPILLLLNIAVLNAATTKHVLLKGQSQEKLVNEITKEITLYKNVKVDSTCEKQVPYIKNECEMVTKYRSEEQDSTCQRDIPYVVNECNMETKYRNETRPDTCSREVPYQENICHNETKYRNECHFKPSRRVCRDKVDRVCRNVTRYKKECSRAPSRQVCENTPSRRVCRDKVKQVCHNETKYKQECSRGPSKQICEDKPSKQVCETKPSHQVCRRQPNGQQRCRKVPARKVCREIAGGRTCRNVQGEKSCRKVSYNDQVCKNQTKQVCKEVPGSRTCRDVQGQKTCRQVPYNDQVCEDQSRQVCRDIPGKNVCRDIPYDIPVCNMETRYRTETYQCTKTIQVPYEEEVCNDVTRYYSEDYACKKTVQIPYEEKVCKDVTKYKTEQYACKKDKSVPYIVTKKIINNVELLINDMRKDFKEAGLDIIFDDNNSASKIITKTKAKVALIRVGTISQIDGQDLGDVIEKNQIYKVTLSDSKELIAPVVDKIKVKSFSTNGIVFSAGDTVDENIATFNVLIELKMKPFLRKTKTVFSKTFILNQLKTSKGEYTIKFDQEIKSRKYDIFISISPRSRRYSYINPDFNFDGVANLNKKIKASK